MLKERKYAGVPTYPNILAFAETSIWNQMETDNIRWNAEQFKVQNC